MKIKIFYSILILLLFILFLIFLNPKKEIYYVKEANSPTKITFTNNKIFEIKDIITFDSNFSENNKILATKLNLTEKETFILGNQAKYWSKNILEGQKVQVYNDDLIFNRLSYKNKLINSPYGIKDNKFTNEKLANKLIEKNRKTNYKIFDLNEEEFYEITKTNENREFIIKKAPKTKIKKNIKNYINKKESLAKCARLKNIHLPQ